MHYCPTCHKPIWDTLSPRDMTTNIRMDAYCQCPRITIYLSEYCHEVLKSLSRQLTPQPARVEVPQAFYDAIGDEEMPL